MEAWNSHNRNKKWNHKTDGSFDITPRKVQPDRILRNAVVPQLHEAEGIYDNK
jgi:hypothetical protein